MTVQADVAPGVQAATRRAGAGAEDRGAERAACRADTISRSAERSRRAARRRVSVAAVLPLMLILILTVLMIQLQSFNRLFLVLSVAPLGLIGVVAALLLADKPLGFVALLGVLALTGMIARNSVILIDQIEKEKARGRTPGMRSSRPRAPLPPDPAHRRRRDPRHDPDRADRLLGSDGLRDHGRPGGRDAADPRLPSGALRDVVPDQGACAGAIAIRRRPSAAEAKGRLDPAE